MGICLTGGSWIPSNETAWHGPIWWKDADDQYEEAPFFWLKRRYHVVTLWKIKHGNGKSWEIPYKWRFWWKIINGRFFSTPRLSTGGHIPLHSQYAPFAWWIHHFSSVNPPFFGSETPRLLPQRAARSLVRRDVAMLMIPKYMKF